MKRLSILIALLSTISCSSIKNIDSNKIFCQNLEGVADFSNNLDNIKSRYNIIINDGEVVNFRLLSTFGTPLVILRFNNSSLSDIIVRGNQVEEGLLKSYLQDYGIVLPDLNYLPYWLLGHPRGENFNLVSESNHEINFKESGWDITSTFSSENAIPVRNVFKYKGTIIRLEIQNSLLTCNGV